MPTPTLDLLLDAEQLLDLDMTSIRLVDLSRESVHQQLHLPNAVPLSPKALLRQHEETTGLLPDVEVLQQLIRTLQLSPHHHVIAYDDEGGAWAGRLVWTLHCMGFYQTSIINGGIHACLSAGVNTTADETILPAVEQYYQPTFSQIAQHRIEYAELMQRVQQQDLQLWDCRSAEEFSGEKRMARRAGHIPNAIHYDWTCLFDRERQLKLYPLEQIRQQLQQRGFDLSQPVVVYCQSHHRSSLAYLVGRLLNWQIIAYDGAWSEWGNQTDSIIVTGN